MTQGRFETVINCRPENWDDRDFWTKERDGKLDTSITCEHDGRKSQRRAMSAQHYPNGVRFKRCEDDHMYRESCPFHDLKADGCFQPEYSGPGVKAYTLTPEELFHRKGTKPFMTSTSRPHKGVGCGGKLVPEDVCPGQPQTSLLRKLDSRPWTRTAKSSGPFSYPPHMVAPPLDKKIPPPEPHFKTDKNLDHPGVPYPHMVDEYQPPQRGREPFRLQAGKVPYRLDPRMRFEPGPNEKERKKRNPSVPRNSFFNSGNLLGTFGRISQYIPLPYEEPKLKHNRRPLFTWWTHTKRSMPVSVPWTTGLTTAEPLRGKMRPASAAVR